MNLIESLKKNKRLWLVIAGTVIGVILLFLGGGSNGRDTEVKNDELMLSEYSREVEEKVEEMCSRVKGVSNVSVVVSFESGFEYVYAREENGDLVVIGSGSAKSAVKVKEKMPVIGGIGIVCKGGGDPTVQKKLLDLISAAFGVSSSKIYIAEAKK